MKDLKRFFAVLCAAMTVALTLACPMAVAEEMEAISIELPEPFFGGTPLDYWGPNLEPEDYKDRPPYLAPKGTAVVSKGKAVSSSFKEPLLGELAQITDGDKNYAKGSLVELGNGVQWVQVDLEAAHDIYAILLWHFHEGKRVYFDVVAKISDDPDFKENVTVIYNNDFDNSAGLGVGKDKEYIENNKGRLITLPDGVTGRYVRLYSNGNTANEMNHYVEVEVFGKPAAGKAGATEVAAAAEKKAGAAKLVPVAIELPEPFFGGTPLDYWGPNLEPEDYKDRPPYLAPEGTAVISKGKAVSSSFKEPLLGELAQLTDGDKNYAKGSLVELGNGVQWVQVDLEQRADIYAILLWHFHEGKRVYFDVVAKISDDPDFKENVTVIYNNDFDNSAGLGVGKDKEYIENNKGRLITLPDGVSGRYVRLYSNGNTANEMNHYVEVEVFGVPAS